MTVTKGAEKARTRLPGLLLSRAILDGLDALPEVARARPKRSDVFAQGVHGVVEPNDDSDQHVHVGAQRTRIVLANRPCEQALEGP